MKAKRFNPDNKEKLFTDKRFETLKPAELLTDLGLKKGDVFIDVGSGNGFFSLPGAEIVGEEGKVYSVDVEIDMLLDLKNRAQQAGLTDRIEICKSENTDSNLNQKADLILFAYLFHEVDQKGEFLDNYFKLLKKGTKVIFIEWDPAEREVGPPLESRISSKKIKNILEKRGIKKIEVKEMAYNSYLIEGVML